MLVAGMLTMGLGAQAQGPEDGGQYYLYNVGAKSCVVGANNWGTRASVGLKGGILITAVQAGDGFELQTAPTYSGKHLGFNGYVDNGDADQNWIIEDYGSYVTLATADGNVLFWDGEGTTTTTVGADPGTDASHWIFLTKEEMAVKVMEATESNPVDATMFITNPNFSREAKGNGWTMESSNYNPQGGANENTCAESWRAVFTLTQDVYDLPNGIYGVYAQAALTDYANLYDGADYPVVFANEEEAPFNNMEEGDRGTDMGKLSQAFTAGKYGVNLYIEVVNGYISLGVRGTRTDTWAIWDNFQLTYYGEDANIDMLKNAALFEKVATLRDQLNELINSGNVEIQSILSEITAAYDNAANVTTASAAEAAVSSLEAAIAKGQLYANSKKALEGWYNVLYSTNVYTQEAFEAYKAAYDETKASYEAGQLSSAIQNPESTFGWHVDNIIDDFLMSAWTINGEQCVNYDKALYINTWSVEGANDGSGFLVPFFEYWTGDTNSLEAATIEATVEGLTAGEEYDVTAWVRVRLKNGETEPMADCITMNGVDVTAGEQVGESQFRIMEAEAKATALLDGTIKITFEVADKEINNISWLSFKNVKYYSNGVADGIKTVATEKENATIFNLAGQQVRNAQKGIFIQNGKKYIK